ncbi:MAG: hypothetical protein AB7U99_11360, partial [Steroidobacteraceae bacterium]
VIGSEVNSPLTEKFVAMSHLVTRGNLCRCRAIGLVLATLSATICCAARRFLITSTWARNTVSDRATDAIQQIRLTARPLPKSI